MSVLSQSTLTVLERAKRGDDPPERIPHSRRLDRIQTPTLCADYRIRGRRVYKNGAYTGELSGLVVHSAIPSGRGRYEWTHGDSFEGQWKTVVRPKTSLDTTNLEDSVEEIDAQNENAVPEGGAPPEGEDGEKLRKGTNVSTGEKIPGENSTSEFGETAERPITAITLSTYSPFYREESTRPHGKGKYQWSTGEAYEGEYKDGRRNGVGKYTWPNGDVYEGQWRKGKMHGKGVYTYGATGDIFEGTYVNNTREGPGVHTVQPRAASADGATPAVPGIVYRGTWHNNKKEGEFKAVHEDGTEEVKNFVAGVDSAAPKAGKKK